jgi:hypothetical protein
MSLTFWPGGTDTNSWKSGAIAAGPLVGGTSYVTGQIPTAHTYRGESLYSLVYLKYHQLWSIQSLSALASGYRTAAFNIDHGFRVGDVITIAGTVSLNETATITSVPTSKTFQYPSSIAGTSGAVGTASLATNRTYYSISIKATSPSGYKSTCTIGIGAAKNTAATAIANPSAAPTLYGGGAFASTLTLPDAVIGRSGGVGGLTIGEWVPIWVKRTASTYTAFTSTSTADVPLTLSVTAKY